MYMGSFPVFGRIQCRVSNTKFWFICYTLSDLLCSKDKYWLSEHIHWVAAYEVIVCSSLWGCIHEFQMLHYLNPLQKKVSLSHICWLISSFWHSVWSLIFLVFPFFFFFFFEDVIVVVIPYVAVSQCYRRISALNIYNRVFWYCLGFAVHRHH